MPTLTIKNIPNDLYRDLKRAATASRRSLNGQVIHCLESQLRSRPIDPKEFLPRIQRLHERLPKLNLNDEDLRKAKNWGRP